jgi:hypothetical protein
MHSRQTRISPQPLGERTRVMIEPVDDDAAQAVLSRLKEIGATRIHEIATGFISAEVPTEEIESIEALARTGILPQKQARKS